MTPEMGRNEKDKRYVYIPGACDLYNCEPGTAAQKFLTSAVGPPGCNFDKLDAEDYGLSLPIPSVAVANTVWERFPVDVAIVLPLTVSSIAIIRH
jgi:hypothetical protein